MKIHFPFIILTTSLIFLNGCGESGSQTDNVPDITSSAYVTLNLSNGSVTPSESSPGTGSNSLIVLKKISSANRLIGITEVTRGQWTYLMNTKPWQTLPTELADNAPSDVESLPVANISLEQAQSFLNTLKAKVGVTVQLPTSSDLEGLIPLSGSGPQAVYDGSSSALTSFIRVTSQSHHGGYYGLDGNVSEYVSNATTSWGKNITSLKNASIPTNSPLCLSGLRLAIY